MCDKDCCAVEEKENVGIFKVIGMLVAFVVLVAGAIAATVVVLKKVKKAIAQINVDTDFEPLDEEDLTNTDSAEEGEEVGEGCRIGEEAE